MLKIDTVHPELLVVLKLLMKLSELKDFRLVGGTALSLLLGHRISIDIDLFVDKEYGATRFDLIEGVLKEIFPYLQNTFSTIVSASSPLENNYGLHLYLGKSEEERIKTDILFWDAAFIFEPLIIDEIRIATIEEIATMKLDAISRGGRKKDFWDLSEILDHYSFKYLLNLYELKYPYHNVSDVINGMTNFVEADDMPDPICLKGKYWDVIKFEMIVEIDKYKST